MSNTAQPANSLPRKFRPPVVSLLYAGGWSFVTHELFYLGKQGLEWGTFACCISGAVAMGQLVKAYNDHRRVETIYRKADLLKRSSKQYGMARFSNEEDLAAAPFLSKDRGVFLGTFPTGKTSSRDVYFDGETSISIIAPAGENKTMSIIVPTMLSNPGQNLIVHDPSGECYSICERALKRAGYKCLVLTPFADKVSRVIGRSVVDKGIDVFSSLHPEMNPADVRSHLERIMQWVMPGKPEMSIKIDSSIAQPE